MISNRMCYDKKGHPELAARRVFRIYLFGRFVVPPSPNKPRHPELDSGSTNWVVVITVNNGQR